MAIDLDSSNYHTGTATVQQGSTTVTGTNTSWQLALRAGDMFGTHVGDGIRILSIESNTSMTLAYPWVGESQTNAPYEVQLTLQAIGYQKAVRELLLILTNGNIEAFASLAGEVDQIPMFTGPAAMTTISRQDLINGVRFDATANTLPELSQYDDKQALFSVFVSDAGDGRSAIYIKKSAAVGDWSNPAYITGPVGPSIEINVGNTLTLPAGTNATVTNSGTPTAPVLEFGIPAGEGFKSRGDYAPATPYNKGDVVQYNGSSFIANVATTGNPPPAPPATGNNQWQLLAKMGDGGDMYKSVYDPTGQNRDIFAAINDKTFMYDTVAIAAAATIPANIHAIIISGYYAYGDFGEAMYRRVTTEPTHAGKLQSADGAWWEIVGVELNAQCFGVTPTVQGGSNNQFGSAIDWSVKTGGIIVITAGTYNAGGRNIFNEGKFGAKGEVTILSQWTNMPPLMDVVYGVINFQNANPDNLSMVNQSIPAQILPFSGVVTDGIDEVVSPLSGQNLEPFLLPWSGSLTTPESPLPVGFSYVDDNLVFDMTNSSIPSNNFVMGVLPAQVGVLFESSVQTPSPTTNQARGIMLTGGNFNGANFTVIIWQNNSNNSFAPTVYWKNHSTNATGSYVLWNIHGQHLQESMRFNWSTLGVRLISSTLAQIVTNGVCIGYVTAPVGGFTGVGFGTYKQAATGNVSVNNTTATYNANIPVAPASVLFFGDSITDPRYSNWPSYIKPMINGANGLYISDTKNIAVSGNTSAQQLAAINAEDISKYNIVIGMVGTNDIQQQVDINVFINNINGIINKATSTGAILVMGIPPQYYDRTLAQKYGVTGANPVNSEKGSIYRTALNKTIATARKNGKVVIAVDIGRLSAVNLARSLTYKYPLTPDNLHPSGGYSLTIAKAFARSLMSLLRGGSIGQNDLSLISGRFFKNGWRWEHWQLSLFNISPSGNKKIVVNALGGTITDGTVIMKLPPMLRPLGEEVRPAGTSSAKPSGVCKVHIKPNGDVEVYGAEGFVGFEAEYR